MTTIDHNAEAMAAYRRLFPEAAVPTPEPPKVDYRRIAGQIGAIKAVIQNCQDGISLFRVPPVAVVFTIGKEGAE